MSVAEIHTILNVPLVVSSRSGVMEYIESRALESGGASVHLCNAYTFINVQRNPDYLRVLQKINAVCVVDGVPLAWALRMDPDVSAPVAAYRGLDLMLDIIDSRSGRDRPHILFGGTEASLGAVLAGLRSRLPVLHVSGIHAPPYGEVSPEWYDKLRALVAASDKVPFVWVGVGTPKQDFLMRGALERGIPAVYFGVGAAFDFLSGEVREAPLFLRGSGLEWLYRLAMEPRRLWRRYVIGNLFFLAAVGSAIIRKWLVRLLGVRGRDDD